MIFVSTLAFKAVIPKYRASKGLTNGILTFLLPPGVYVFLGLQHG